MSDLYKELDYAVQSDLYASGKFIKMYNDLLQENKQLKEDKKKAIEYIKSYRDENTNWYEFTIQNKIELLEILGDKE